MGKNDIEQMLQASRQPQLQVATPQTWEQLVAWVAAHVYGKVGFVALPENEEEASVKAAVDVAVAIVARSAGVVKSGVLQRAAQAEMARLEQEQADQGNPSTAQN
jgi:transposase